MYQQVVTVEPYCSRSASGILQQQMLRIIDGIGVSVYCV
jgi:hypothetical protein